MSLYLFFRVIGYFYTFYRLYFSIFHVFFPRIRYRAVGKSRGCLHNAFYTGKYFLHSIVGTARKIQVFHGNSSFSAVFVSDKFMSYFMVKMKNPPEVLPPGVFLHTYYFLIFCFFQVARRSPIHIKDTDEFRNCLAG